MRRTQVSLREAVARGIHRGRAAARASVMGSGHEPAEEGMTMGVVAHAVGFARRVGTRPISLGHGHPAVDRPPAAPIDHPPKQRLRDFLPHIE